MSASAPVEIARLGDPEARMAYADLLAASPQRTAFAGLAFADAVCDIFGLTGRIALLRGADGEAEIGAVLFEKTTGPFRQVVVPPLTPYTGPLLRAEVGLGSTEALRTFLEALKPRYASVSFQPPPAVADVRPFQWAGYIATPRYTYWGPTGLDDAPRYVRRTMRKYSPVRVDGSVRETGTEVRPDPSAARDVVAATERVFARIGKPGQIDSDRTERLVERLVEAGVAQVVVAETQGARVGAIATLTDDQTGHFWTGAGDPGPSMLLMMAETSRVLAERGVPDFDLCGANIARVATFKAQFGMPLAVHYRTSWTGSHVLRLRAALRRP